MTDVAAEPHPRPRPPARLYFRNWFARTLGVRPDRKAEIYVGLSESATLLDPAYWLEIVFSCGIATLGLVLSSPAVIIGAMLISPLMGPILASGLALAAGDLLLGIRSLANIVLSCLAAVLFSALLVALLPFKDVTPEIAARTQPNTLDLVIAFFSGAVGSIATCKKLKGIATSIPGVAIAVALMPPLCVVGYGVGVAFTLSPIEGLDIARGGGLLFLTNLLAITFTAMVVFLALNINISLVRERVREWVEEDLESRALRRFIGRIPRSGKVKVIGSLPSRFLLLGSFLALLFIPLSQSFTNLKLEIGRKQLENRVQRAATQTWQQNFARFPNGAVRSYLDSISPREENAKLMVNLRIITSRPYSPVEQQHFSDLVAARLNLPPERVGVEIVEIPTSQAELRERLQEERRLPVTPPPPSIRELQQSLLRTFDTALAGLVIPPPAALLDASITSSSQGSIVQIAYISPREVDADGRVLLTEELRKRLSLPGSQFTFEWIARSVEIPFAPGSSRLGENDRRAIQQVAAVLARFPRARIELWVGFLPREPSAVGEARAAAIVEEIRSRVSIPAERLVVTVSETDQRKAELIVVTGS